jgi:hypothetical protein
VVEEEDAADVREEEEVEMRELLVADGELEETLDGNEEEEVSNVPLWFATTWLFVKLLLLVIVSLVLVVFESLRDSMAASDATITAITRMVIVIAVDTAKRFWFCRIYGQFE